MAEVGLPEGPKGRAPQPRQLAPGWAVGECVRWVQWGWWKKGGALQMPSFRRENSARGRTGKPSKVWLQQPTKPVISAVGLGPTLRANDQTPWFSRRHHPTHRPPCHRPEAVSWVS